MDSIPGVEFVTDPALAAYFATFAAGVTQIVKRKFGISKTLEIQLTSIAAFTCGVFMHFYLPDTMQLFFDIVAGGVGVTGSVGLAKELIEGKKAE